LLAAITVSGLDLLRGALPCGIVCPPFGKGFLDLRDFMKDVAEILVE
jgi:hypothetical protein